MAQTKSSKRHRRARQRNTRQMYAAFQREAVTHNRPMPSREEARETVRQARARHLDMQASEIMDVPMLGEQAGRAIAIGADSEEEAARLWETFKVMDGAAEAYSRRIIGKPRFPNVAKLEAIPERFETRADDRPDIRPPEQKDADAKRAWLHWCNMASRLHPPLHAALHMSLRQKVQLHQGRALTGTGRLFIAAMRRIDNIWRKGVDGAQEAR